MEPPPMKKWKIMETENRISDSFNFLVSWITRTLAIPLNLLFKNNRIGNSAMPLGCLRKDNTICDLAIPLDCLCKDHVVTDLAIPVDSLPKNDYIISDLPDEILWTILLLLPLKEAASTCVLSRRWRNTWAMMWEFRMNLDFDFPKNCIDPQQCDLLESANPKYYQIPDLFKFQKERASNIECVEGVVNNHHKGKSIDQFRISFDLDVKSRVTINNWIKFAMRKRVKFLQLNFQQGDYFDKPKYRFPKNLLGLKHIGYKSLQVLELEYLNVSGEILERFLSLCPLLERLTVHDSDDLEILRVVGPSIALKHLDLRLCRRLRSIEIRDTNLVSFYISRYDWINIVLQNVPKLVEVSIPVLQNFNENQLISGYFSQLQILKLTLFSGGILWRLRREEQFPVFTNVKHLELLFEGLDIWSSDQANSILKACPYLETFVLKMPPDLYQKSFSFPIAYGYLKVVKILGYSCCKHEYGFVDYLIQYATALEKIIIDTRKYYKLHKSLKDKEDEKNWRSHAMKQIKTKIPRNIKFICL